MLFHVKATINKPPDMTNKEFYGLWLEEAEAATAAMQGGPIKGLWKAAGEPVIIGVLDVASHDMVDEALLSLPFWTHGYSHIVDIEVTPLRPYEHWHEHLKTLAAG